MAGTTDNFIKAAKPQAKWSVWAASTAALPTPATDFGHSSDLELKLAKSSGVIDTDSIFPIALKFLTGCTITGKFNCHEADLDRIRLAAGEASAVTTTFNFDEGTDLYLAMSFLIPSQTFTDNAVAKTSRLWTFRKCLIEGDVTIKYDKKGHEVKQVSFTAMYDSYGTTGKTFVVADS